jgi:uncharacterized membrane protein YbhN (UPF0104 family)
MKIKINKKISLVVRLLVTGCALYFVFRRIDMKELAQVLLHVNIPLVLVATLAFILSKIVSSFRLNRFLRDEKIELTAKLNLKLYWLGMYYNLFLPGGIGGDGYKVYLINKLSGVKVKFVLRAILMDRVSGLLALVCLNLVLVFSLPILSQYKIYMLILIPLTVAAFYFIIRYFFRVYIKSFLKTNLQAFLVQILQVISAFVILRAIGIDELYAQYLFVFLLSSVIATIPFTIGGVGAREVTFLLGAEYLGLQTEASLGLSLIFFLITAIVSLFGIIYSFHLPETKLQNKNANN